MKALSHRATLVVTSLPTPTTALAGSMVRLSTDNRPYWCDGTAWLEMANPKITVSTTAPSSPSTNDIWIQY